MNAATIAKGILTFAKRIVVGTPDTTPDQEGRQVVVPDHVKTLIDRRIQFCGNGTPRPGTIPAALAKRFDAEIKKELDKANPPPTQTK